MHTAASSAVFLLAGSGTLGWDQVGANLVEPGDRVLVIQTGYFGEGFKEWCVYPLRRVRIYTWDSHLVCIQSRDLRRARNDARRTPRRHRLAW